MTADRRQLPSISFIVARSVPGNVIGCENRLPWRLKNDLKRFRELTSGHAVIMGRKTYQSIGRPLPNRLNVVISRSLAGMEYVVPGNDTKTIFVGGYEDALYQSDFYSLKKGLNDIFVIGGGEIYKLFQKRFNKIYLTEVYAPKIEGDAFFDFKFDLRKWNKIESKRYEASDQDEFSFEFITFEKKDKTIRHISDYFTDSESRNRWLERMIEDGFGQNLEPKRVDPNLVGESERLEELELSLSGGRSGRAYS